jgi:hypothetical protein
MEMSDVMRRVPFHVTSSAREGKRIQKTGGEPMMHVLSRSRMACAGLVAGAALALQATPGFGAVVFSDDFNGYANVTELRAAWTKADVTTPNNSDVNLVTTFDVDNNTTGTAGLGTGVADQALASNAMSLGNGVWYHTLDSAINGDWTLSTKMIHSAYTRSGGIGLMNGAGTQGYVLRWSSARVDQESGGGSITMRRFDLPVAIPPRDLPSQPSMRLIRHSLPRPPTIPPGSGLLIS